MKFSEFQVGDYVAFDTDITPDQFEAFSCLSADRNRLHWDEHAGATSSFGGTIVPLFLAVAPFSGVAGMALPGEPSLIVQQEFDAVGPISYGKTLTYSARIERTLASERVLALSLLVAAGDQVVIRGRMTTQCRMEEWSDVALNDPRFAVRRVPRLALVTGAAGAIGRATVRALAAANWEVWPIARTGAAILPENDRHAGRVRATWIADLAHASDLKSLEQAVSADPPGLIVHCASAPYRSQVEQLVATNFTALEGLTGACMPAFLARQSGRIVFVGSLAQRTYPREVTGYAAAKEMTAHLLDGLNLQFNCYGISAVTLMPDLVRSPFGSGLKSNSGLLLEPEEVAEAIVNVAASSLSRGRYVLDHRGLRPAEEVRTSSGSELELQTSNGRTKDHAMSEETGPFPNSSLRERLRAVFARVLPASTTLPENALRLGEVERWDSLEHIKLMIEIERCFSISLATHDISDATTFAGILELIQSQPSTS